jgi:hypothetical protein
MSDHPVSDLVRCKYCDQDRPRTAFEVCRVVNGKEYRRLRCRQCKRARTNVRRTALRQWLDDYKKTLRCERCGFADFRALEFHHPGTQDKDANVADMIRSGLSRKTIKREIDKCVVLCSNCHQIEHYVERR